MASVFLPQGFYSPRRMNGDHVRLMALRGGIASAYNTAIGIGDPIKFVTGGVIEKCAVTEALVAGVFAGWLPEDASVYEKTYWAANTTYVKPPVVYWYPVEDVVYSVQAVGSVAQTAIGDAADPVAGTLNTNSGKSGAYLDTANLVGAGNSAQWKIVGLRQEPGNTWGDTYTIVDVIANEVGLAFRPGNAI